MPVEKTCVVCGRLFLVPPCREATAKACSNACASSVRAKSNSSGFTFQCACCGKITPTIPSQVERRRFCSVECQFSDTAYKKEQGDRVAMDKNPMWNGGETMHTEGYVYVRMPTHPFASNGYVFKHRIVIEKFLRKNFPDSPFLVKLGNNLYLSPEVVVHHKNTIRDDNRKRNLSVMSKGEHTSLHNLIRRLKELKKENKHE